MAKEKTIVIGEQVETESNEDKKKKLSNKSMMILGGILGGVVLISLVGTSGSGSGKNILKEADPGTSLDPVFEDKDIWREKSQQRTDKILKQLEHISKELEVVTNGRKALSQEMANVSAQVKDMSGKTNSFSTRLDEMEERTKNEFKNLYQELEERPVQVAAPLDGDEAPMQVINSNNSSILGTPKIPLPGQDFSNNKPVADFKMPDPKISPEDKQSVPKPPANPFATIKAVQKQPKVVSSTTKTVEVVKEVPKPEGMLIAGMSQEEANKYTQMKVKASRKLVESEFAGYLPEGSFAEVSVISGLDAGASSETQKNPQPVLLRIQSNALIPAMQGTLKYKLKGCFLVGSAIGEISTERVLIKPTRLSCIDGARQYVLSAKVDGYISDFDNVLGLRGDVEYRDGARIAKSILASTAGALAQIAAVGGGVSTSTIGSGITYDDSGNLNLPTMGDLGAAAGVSAFGGAVDIIAKRYAEQAAEIYPVISLPGGRKGTVTFTTGVNLKWKRYGALYEEEITPDENAVPEVIKGGILAR